MLKNVIAGLIKQLININMNEQYKIIIVSMTKNIEVAAKEALKNSVCVPVIKIIQLVSGDNGKKDDFEAE